MPGFNGKGPRSGGGRGRGQRSGLGGGYGGMQRGRRSGAGLDNAGFIDKAMQTHPYIYQYTLDELKERKSALEEEIGWLNDRIKELEKQE